MAVTVALVTQTPNRLSYLLTADAQGGVASARTLPRSTKLALGVSSWVRERLAAPRISPKSNTRRAS